MMISAKQHTQARDDGPAFEAGVTVPDCLGGEWWEL